jgi:PPOX class probable FMN-dependent enzyme
MQIDSIEKLRSIYGAPKERAVKKQLSALDAYCQQYLALSPFVVVASGSVEQKLDLGVAHYLDASPRGGMPGFVKVLDAHTLLIPDSPGNNRLDTLENVIRTGEVGLLFFIPGMDETLRVNGQASLHTDLPYLYLCTSELRAPKLVIRVSVREAYLHCAKAFMRSKLWNQQSHIDRQQMPTMNEMVGAQTGINSESEQETMKRYLAEL